MDKRKFKSRLQKEIRKTKLNARIASVFFVTTINLFVLFGVIGYVCLKAGFTPEKEVYPIAGMWVNMTICVTLSSIASYYLFKKIFAPLEELSKASQKVADGNFEIEVEYRGNLEKLKNTIGNFNRMVKELNSVEIMQNDFVADVSHEFKTPLAAITGYATFLQDPELTEEERDEYIHKILFHVGKLNELTENILRLSKLEHQQFMDEPVEYRLDEQLREAIVLLEPKWSEKNINLDLQLPEVWYMGQKGLLFQVWMNVIGNAVKYTDDGGEIQVVLSEKNEFFEISVKDDGIGMSEEVQSHIFDKFYQADTSRKEQGNGLGLALCKEILHKCDGKIWVESRERTGSRFVVQLPKL